MSRPPHKLRPQDLNATQIGALLLAWRGPLQFARRASKPARWTGADDLGFVDRHTFQRLEHMGLLRTKGAGTELRGTLTPTGLRLADLLVTLSREIAAGVAGRSARTFLPVIVEPLPEASPAFRLNTHPTPRDVIGAQLRRAGKVIA